MQTISKRVPDLTLRSVFCRGPTVLFQEFRSFKVKLKAKFVHVVLALFSY